MNVIVLWDQFEHLSEDLSDVSRRMDTICTRAKIDNDVLYGVFVSSHSHRVCDQGCGDQDDQFQEEAQ